MEFHCTQISRWKIHWRIIRAIHCVFIERDSWVPHWRYYWRSNWHSGDTTITNRLLCTLSSRAILLFFVLFFFFFSLALSILRLLSSIQSSFRFLKIPPQPWFLTIKCTTKKKPTHIYKLQNRSHFIAIERKNTKHSTLNLVFVRILICSFDRL